MGVRLVLGCGDEQREGWVHLDRWRHSSHVDVVHDLNVMPWPFEDDTRCCLMIHRKVSETAEVIN